RRSRGGRRSSIDAATSARPRRVDRRAATKDQRCVRPDRSTVTRACAVNLLLDDDELSACVQCGLCLPHCPTYRVTGEESASPRGRIALMREVQQHGAAVDEAFVGYMDACVQCRACEPACPAGVPFGRLMERTRETLADTRPSYVPRLRRLGYRALARHGLVLGGSKALGVAQRLHLWPRRLSRRL